MPGIAAKIALYNKAFNLAWSSVSERPDLQGKVTAERLGQQIRLQLTMGGSDAATIAADALKDVQKI